MGPESYMTAPVWVLWQDMRGFRPDSADRTQMSGTGAPRQCPACGEVSDARARFCASCGEPLSSEERSRQERKVVTFLFVDLVGSTALAERVDPEILRDVLFRYYRHVTGVIKSLGGTTEKFIGDAVLGVFGLPRVSEDDALRAVRAAAEISRSLSTLNAALQDQYQLEIAIRIGVNTGEIVVGEGASASSLIAADMLNVAARLQQSASPNGILIGDATARLVRHVIPLRRVEERNLEGRSVPVTAWELAAEEETADVLPAAFVGRADQLQTLNDAFARAMSNRAAVLVTIVASPGAGKSRLAAEFTESLQEARTLTGSCLAFGEGITFWPLRHVLMAAAEIADEDDPAGAERKIASLLGESEDASGAAARLAGAVGLRDSAVETQEIFLAARRLFETMARKQPLVIVWEDIHWGEPSFLRLVRYLVRRCSAPILFVALSRPELFEAAPRWRNQDENHWLVDLPPLGESHVDRLIDEVLGGTVIDHRTRQRIVQVAGGNPLYVQEIARMIRDEPVASGAEIPVPPTVNAVIAARLDRLATEDKALLQRAAVVGLDFDERAIRHLTPRAERSGLADRFRRLEQRGLICVERRDSTERSLVFVHGLVQEGAYQTIPKAQRADLHASYARWLEQRDYAARGYEEIMGYHFERAYAYKAELHEADESDGLAQRSAHYLAIAGRRAVARGDMSAAAKLLWRAQSLTRDATIRAELVLELLFPLRQVGRTEDARALLREVRETVAPDAAERFGARAALIERFWGERNSRWATEARVDIQRAGMVFEEVGDELGSAIASLLATDVDRFEGRYGAAVESAARALRYARKAGDDRTAEGALRRIVWGNVFGPAHVDDALARCQKIVSTTDLPGLEANTLLAMGVLHSMAGRVDEAHDLATRGRLMLEELGAALAVAHIPILVGHIHVFSGDLERAQIAFRSALEALERWGVNEAAAEVAWAAVCLARVLFDLGHYDDGRSAIEISEAAVASTHLNVRADRVAVAAKLLLRAGDEEGADRLSREAMALAERTDDLKAQGDVALDRALVLSAVGDEAGARRAQESAVAAYAKKGIIVFADRVARATTGTV